MKRVLSTLLVVIFLTLGFASPASAAGTIYLNPNDNIGVAVSNLPNGGTIYLRTGTWSSDQVINGRNPSATVFITTIDGPVTMPNFGILNSSNISVSNINVTVRLDCNGCSNSAIDHITTSKIFLTASPMNVSVTNSTVTNSPDIGIEVSNYNKPAVSNITIQGNAVTGAAQRGIMASNVDGLKVSRNRVNSAPGGSEAIALFSLMNSSIDANTVTSAASSGIVLYRNNNRSSNVAITNNVVLSSGARGFIIGDSDGVVFSNNTVAFSSFYQFAFFQGTVTSATVTNNLGYGLDGVFNTSSSTFDYNCFTDGNNIGPHGIAAAINVDAQGKPNTGHPCIARGTSLGATAVSYNGVTRPAAIDIGAWQVTLLSGAGNATVAIAVAPTASLTLGTSTTCNGVSNSAGSSSGPTSVVLGSVSSANNATASQQITAATNAAAGFSVLIRSTGTLSDGRGNSIADVPGTNSTPQAFPNAGTPAFGYTSGDASLSGVPNRFTVGPEWAALSSVPAEIAFTAVPESQTSCVGFQVGASAATPAGSYTAQVNYTLVPAF